MPDDSTFFSIPSSTEDTRTLPPEGPRLVHRSASGWTEIWQIDKDGRFRALKALKPEFRGQVKYETLLRKEYEIGYSLSHTAIRAVYDYREIPGLGHCIEMEWIDGMTLGDYLSTRNPDRITARKLAVELCDALAYMHSKQIIHRDVKPSNTLVTHNGNNLKLIDFGFSDADSYSILKRPGGTASFAAPELLSGTSVDNRADIWSLGKVISILLPKERRLVRRCTRIDPIERFRDAAEVKAALVRKREWWPFATAFAVLAVVIFLAFALLPRHREALPELVPAEDNADTVDVGAIDELFRQATEMIDGSRSQ